MTVITSSLSQDARKVTGEALQGALVDLIDLSLLAKQAHWNLIGPRFRSVHLQLDEVVSIARRHTDLIAERASAVGVSPDGRSGTVASASGLPKLAAGWLHDDKVVDQIVSILHVVVGRLRDGIVATAQPDPVTQDLLIDVTAELEKQAWMFQAMGRP